MLITQPKGATQPIKILLAEDNPADVDLELRELKRAAIPVEYRAVSTQSDFRSTLAAFAPDVILCDFSFPDFDGLAALKIAREVAPDTPFIFVTGSLSEERAVIAVQNGAADYVLKSSLLRLAGAVLRAVEEAAERKQRRLLEARLLRVNRIREVLSAVNAAIVRIRERDPLIQEACRIAFRGGGFVNVFAIWIEPVTGAVTLAATEGQWAATREDYEAPLAAAVKGPCADGTVVQRAIFTSQPAIENDLRRQRAFAQYRRVLEQGVLASGAFPLTIEGRIVGLVTFDSREAGFFDDEEIELLTALTNNLSFALDHIHRQARVARLSRIRDVLSSVNNAIVRIREADQLYHEVCRIAVSAGGFINVFVIELDLESRAFRMPAFIGESDAGLTAESLRSRFQEGSVPLRQVEAAIRDRLPQVKNAIKDGRRHGREGVRASATFPLIVDGHATGVMVFETAEAEFFDGEEIALLTSLVNNLSFALELLDKQRRVDYLSYYDPLTGLPNRTLFHQRCAQDVAASSLAGKMAAIAIVDLARFALLNNTLGEHVGDEVLRAVAARLRETVGENRIGRIAGDRFALSYPMLDDLRPVIDLASEEGIRLLEPPIIVEEREIPVTARAGCALFPNDGESVETLLANAEAALLSAKASGSTYRFYAPPLNARFAKQLDLEAQLKRAIEEHQFVLFYQPKVEISTRKIVGFEALIRWKNPKRGLIPPSDFIPVLEQTGAIISVGRWALGEAARQYEEWRLAGLRPPRIAVNLSTIQLRSDRLVEDVTSAVATFSAECGLDVEVTESMLMENFSTAIEKLTAIRNLGVNLSLDDFGTGYSSLAYLHRLPLNALKIDRSFVVGMMSDANLTSIVTTIISLGNALRLKIIAEGVEVEDEARLLHLLRCDQIQGYLFGKPQPAEVTAGLLVS